VVVEDEEKEGEEERVAVVAVPVSRL